jgi:hypothetical protein
MRFLECGDIKPAFALRSGGYELRAVADQPIHQSHVGAVSLAFHEVCLRNVTRHKDVGLDAPRRRVRRHGAGRVSSGWNGEFTNSELDGHRNGTGKAARFE